jgi:hypothetical protein
LFLFNDLAFVRIRRKSLRFHLSLFSIPAPTKSPVESVAFASREPQIVSGARRYRAAQRAVLSEVPVRLADISDEEALETQIVENVLRADVHPFEEAQGFRALLDREGSGYTIEKISAKTGKNAAYIAKLCSQEHLAYVAFSVMWPRKLPVARISNFDSRSQHNLMTKKLGWHSDKAPQTRLSRTFIRSGVRPWDRRAWLAVSGCSMLTALRRTARSKNLHKLEGRWG